MTRFEKSLVCLNGPKEGTWIDAPPDVDVGTACAVPWAGGDGVIRYAVYMATMLPDAPKDRDLALMFVRSWAKPGAAQDHVQRLSLVVQAAKMASQAN